MQNTGTWNSDLALFYLAVFLTPLWLKMILWTINTFGANVKVIRVEKEVQVPVTVYRDRTVYKTVPKTPKAPKTQPVKPIKTKVAATPKVTAVVKQLTEASIISDAVSGLRVLGIHKSQGRDLAEKIANKQQYNTAEELLQDCIAHIHKMRT
jgi:hypothetical protein